MRKLSVQDSCFCKSDDEVVEDIESTSEDEEKIIEEEELEVNNKNNGLVINLGTSDLPRISFSNIKYSKCRH